MKSVLICGIDGYIGWCLAMHLAKRGHQVAGLDNLHRRRNVTAMGSASAIPILTMEDRVKHFGGDIEYRFGDTNDYDFLSGFVKDFKPDTIVQLAEQPSAPFSMKNQKQAVYTQQNNVIGSLNIIFAIRENVPDCHLLKLGTLGEYGQPDIEIAENPIEIEYKGRKETIQFPKQPGSFYHLSKLHDTNNILLANRIYGLCCTDVMQGVVYGTRTNEMTDDKLATRFDFDESFGTAINRFVAQAVIGYPLTPYGKGGQTRGYLALIDSIQCLRLAVENPPKEKEYRVFNQFSKTFSVLALANLVQEVAYDCGITTLIDCIENPRIEKESHYYSVESKKLKKLGFQETRDIKDEIHIMFADLLKHKERIKAHWDAIEPSSFWNKESMSVTQ